MYILSVRQAHVFLNATASVLKKEKMTRKKAPKKKKVEIVFDPQKRKEFLTGFRKRKNERRTRAKTELEHNLKAERKRIRQELKDGFKHLKKSHEPLRELTEEDKMTNGDEYEDDEVQVNIVELSTNDLTASRNMLGQNTGGDSDDNAEKTESSSEDEVAETNCIPGMDFDVTVKKSKKANAGSEAKSSASIEKRNAETLGIDASELHSKKDIDRLMKTKTLKKLKKSKVFKMKERFDKKANQKKIKRDRNNTLKSVPKHQRKKLKAEKSNTLYRKGRMVNKKDIRRKRRSGND